MLYIIASYTILTNQTTTIKLWDDMFLQYQQIVSIQGPNSEITDNYTAKITPISQEGTINYTITSLSGAEIVIPIIFKGDYYKNPERIPSYSYYFPDNLFNFNNDNPATALMSAAQSVASEVIAIVDDNPLPFAREFNITFPQFCDNSLIGVAIPFVYKQSKKSDFTQQNTFRFYIKPLATFTDITDVLLQGTVIGTPNAQGKYNTVIYNGDVLFLKYGADANGYFSGKQKCLYIQNVGEVAEEYYLTWDDTDPLKEWNAGKWNSIFNDNEIAPEGWQDSDGLSLSSEVAFNTTTFIVNYDDYNKYYIPSIAKFQGSAYQPTSWIGKLLYNEEDLIITYDKNDGFILYLDKLSENNLI